MSGRRAAWIRAAFTGGFLACALAVGVLFPSSSRADIYWANGWYFVDETGTTISRATNDGGTIVPDFISGYRNPRGVAVDLDGSHVYWSAGGPNISPPEPAQPAAIGRAEAEGGSTDQSWVESGDCEDALDMRSPFNLAIDSTHVYWIDWATEMIGRASLDRSGPNGGVDCDWLDLAPFSPGFASFFGVAVDDEFVYWAQSKVREGFPEFEPGRIGRVAKDGESDPDPDFIAPDDPQAIGAARAIAIDSDHIYWLDSGSSPGRIGRAGIDGSAVNPDFVPAVRVGDGIALDDSFIYFTDFFGPISRVALDGSGPVQEVVPSFPDQNQFRFGLYVTWASGVLTPTDLDLGSIELNPDLPAFGFLTLTSTDGNVPLRIAADGISIAGVDAGDFSIGATSCEAGITTLFPEQSCTVEVAFEPTSTGPKSATLQIATNDGEFTAGLSGTGTEPSPSFTALKLTSKVKRVRAPRKGKKRVTITVRVTNSGDATGTATVRLSSSSRKVKVPAQIRVPVGANASATGRFKVRVPARAPRKVKIAARSGGGGGGKATFSEITITIIKPPKK